MKKMICVCLSGILLAMTLTGCKSLTRLVSEDHFGGSYLASMTGTLMQEDVSNPAVVDGPIMLEMVLGGPLYDGVEKYVDTGMVFWVSAPGAENPAITLTSSDESVVATWCELRTETKSYASLEFEKAGKATVTFTVEETGETVSYDITVRKHYDCNPGKKKLTPEEFVVCFDGVAEANGMKSTNSDSTVKVEAFIEPEALTWTQARVLAEHCVGSWWSEGYRSFNFCYGGTNSSGNHIFYAYLSA